MYKVLITVSNYSGTPTRNDDVMVTIVFATSVLYLYGQWEFSESNAATQQPPLTNTAAQHNTTTL